NLAEQQRIVGAQLGADTTKPAGAPRTAGAAAAAAAPAAVAAPSPAIALLGKNGCVACHGIENKIVGPSFREVAAKHGSRADAVAYLSGKIRSGGAGVWGAIPMPAQTLSEDDANSIAQWLAAGAKK
ncbi:MAG: c-type cytochrome, partial [Burkholderiales bacterium]|nr:c-type cytochrome [Burkholderiales bacterium]